MYIDVQIASPPLRAELALQRSAEPRGDPVRPQPGLQPGRLAGDGRRAVGPDVLEQPHNDLAGPVLRPAAHHAPLPPDGRPDVAGPVEQRRPVRPEEPVPRL